MTTPRLATVAVAALLALAPALPAADATPEQIAEESAKANAFFDRVFDENVARFPEFQTSLGMKTNLDQWNDGSEVAALENFGRAVANLAELKRSIDPARLDEQTRVSYELFVRGVERQIEGFRWRYHNYPVNQQFGVHANVPEFLMNNHRVGTLDDARAYVTRLRTIDRKFAPVFDGLKKREELGIVPPKFVFPLVLETCRNLIAGEPFDASGQKNPLLADIEKKVAALNDVDDATKAAVIAEAKAALLEVFKPTYEKLIATLTAQEKVATDDDGVWKFPHGREYYDYQLRGFTTTNMDADAIHALGLSEVKRIHAEMEAIKRQVAFAGDLPAFFKFMREDPQFYYPNTDEGKAAYLKRATEVIDDMRGRLDSLFGVKPKAPMVVRAVEPFRERASGGAFYQRPTPDGSRPGIYYVNLYDMKAQPKYELEALAYHEGIPGHHMQIAIQQELKGLPKFRLFSGYTAYSEGWGLYTEQLPKEIGLYRDPYSDFGRLSMELWRAARLVVDTGLHAQRWTRKQTMDWLRQNTPNSERDILTETNRYIANAGQATAYKIGMLKLLELRELARRELGTRFDLRAYHDLVLKNGPLPLDYLEESVRRWIAQAKKN